MAEAGTCAFGLQAKDPAEQLAVKKAAHLAASCWKNFTVLELEGKQHLTLHCAYCVHHARCCFFCVQD